jgi:asparagine synthase (glutamine-hydrolysing)
MSCIAGVFRRDAKPVPPAIIERMLDAARGRAPDGNQLQCTSAMGLGQAFLRTGASGAEQVNALTLDGEVFIAADCRIDGRAELTSKLRAQGRKLADDAPHAELVLHAYHAFGDAFIDHLVGDFAFAIWDGRRQRALCFRDHFGVRPLYFFCTDEQVVFASQVESILAHPDACADLDEDALGEFLMFGTCLDPERTVYKQVRCLRRASRLECTANEVARTSYWSLPNEESLRYASDADYVEEFRALFEQAVRDRLPGGPVAVQLSGGMDSTSIAAVAAHWASRSGHAVTGCHMSFASLAPEHDETRLACLVARSLKVPLLKQDVSDYPLFADSQSETLRTPLPVGSAQLAAHRATLRLVEPTGARVLLSGYAGDAVFAPRTDYLTGLLRSGRLQRFAREVWDHYRQTQSLRGLGLRAMFRPHVNLQPAWKPGRPDWIASGPVSQELLDAKWEAWWRQFRGAASAREQLDLPWTSRPLEEFEYLSHPIAWRYPFMDIRLVRHLLRLPPRMLMGKKVLRDAMREKLPPAIVDRPKSVVPLDIVRQLAADGRFHLDCSGMPPAVDAAKFAAAWTTYCAQEVSSSTWSSGLIVLPVALRNWILSTRSRPS